MDFKKWADDHLIVKTIAGSRLYGTHNALSDYDYRGVCLDPPEALLGIHQFHQQENVTKSHDEVIYGAAKFLNMVLAANPSILDILFAPQDAIILASQLWRTIQENANSLLSQKVRHTFTGYAYSQLGRIKRHKQWIDNPPAKPFPEEYDLVLESTEKGGQVLVGHVGDVVQNIKLYKDALSNYKKYNTWKENRNPARAILEEKYGYDVKHAAHLVRLLLQGQMILAGGTYRPRLTGEVRKMVVDVLSGNWDYDELILFAGEQEALIKNMGTDLPKTPNRTVFEGLLRLTATASLLEDDALTNLIRMELCNG